MADLFLSEDVPELDCPGCGASIRLQEGDDEPSCRACGWTPADGDAPRQRSQPATMQKADPVPDLPTVLGRPRNVLACIALGVVTLGLYFLFWQFAAFQEVRLQTRTRQRVELYWSALIISVIAMVWRVVAAGGLRVAATQPTPPDVMVLDVATTTFLSTYLFIEARHVRDAAKASGVPTMAWPGGFLLIGALGALGVVVPGGAPTGLTVVILVLALLVYSLVQMALNDYWRQRRAADAPTPTAPPS